MDTRLFTLSCLFVTGSTLVQFVAGGFRSEGSLAPAPAPEQESLLGGRGASYLFVQMANSATLRLHNPNNVSEGAALVLQGVPDQTIWFTSIPIHKAGRINTSKLTSLNAFWEEAPNAALVGRAAGANDTSSVIVALKRVMYEPKTQRVWYDVDVLLPEGENLTLADTPLAKKPHTYSLMDADSGTALLLFDTNSSTTQLEDVSLFIDNFCYQGLFFQGCWDGAGNSQWSVGVGPFRFGASNVNGCGGGPCGGGCNGPNCGGGWGGGGCNGPNCGGGCNGPNCGGGCNGPNCGGGCNGPNCGPQGCFDQWGNWHWVSEPTGFCDWNRNLWIFFPNGGR